MVGCSDWSIAYSLHGQFCCAFYVLIGHPIYIIYTHKTIYTSFQKPSRKAKICRCHFLPSSIEGGSSNVWQCAPNCSPHTDNDSGAIRAGLRARAKEKWGAGRTLFESAFYSFLFEKSARVVRKRPLISTSWVGLLDRLEWSAGCSCGENNLGRTVKAVEVHLPWRQKMASGKSKALLYGFFEMVYIYLWII